MDKKRTTILAGIIIFSLVLIYSIASTYAVIIDVKDKEGVKEIINVITLRDLVTNADGTYNNIYYDVKNELNITEEEANLIMASDKLNENLQVVLNSIVDFKLDNNIDAKLSNDELYNLIVDGINNTDTLYDELKSKVIEKSNKYKQDISNYVYDINVNLVRGI